MWQDHYQSLSNSVRSIEYKTSVTNTLSYIENESIQIRPFDIVNALKSVNKGKVCGVDGFAQNILFMLMKVSCYFIYFILLFYFPWIFAI